MSLFPDSVMCGRCDVAVWCGCGDDRDAMSAFNNFMEFVTREFIDSQTRNAAAGGGNKFVSCPKCSVPFELDFHTYDVHTTFVRCQCLSLLNPNHLCCLLCSPRRLKQLVDEGFRDVESSDGVG